MHLNQGGRFIELVVRMLNVCLGQLGKLGNLCSVSILRSLTFASEVACRGVCMLVREPVWLEGVHILELWRIYLFCIFFL